jgi:hypothetical protein
MNNYITFSDFIDINEMFNNEINEVELEQLSKDIILAETYEESYALYEGETWQKMKDAFKKNPYEADFKKLLMYVGGAYAGAFTGSRSGSALGKKII